ncbi:exodeoxyribonuclease V subunit beta [Thalassotalea litorea]|uniref:RecBCD enzyme subunit RecB n=1 Tax=Thalassotalea litorea TaxID=2020715 RepID=A0A5R9ILT8_9GAMM|nr:exodeoxyribonuclease V subunit beta [Thalassotalea litorea]TLU66242.1 exodeoxyribonuclease V subunit beta [Thalassotalea litorea]
MVNDTVPTDLQSNSVNHLERPDQHPIATPEFLPLHASSIPLHGSHLIEASAGTGKTFNITRIYLRLLLEKQLNVENILVMTFTKAATEEIRGRIDGFLREAYSHWDQWTADPDNQLFYQLGQNVDAGKAKLALKLALLQLDDAAIFTIHGFCKRVLSQYAFASGVSFNAAMETDDQEYYLHSIEDLYRRLAASPCEQQQFLTMTEFWPSPEAFYQTFIGVCRRDIEPQVQSEQQKLESVQALMKTCLTSLDNNEPLIFEHLVNSKTGKAKSQREDEFSELRQQLQQSISLCTTAETFGGILIDFAFCGAARLPKSKDKTEQKLALQRAFQPLYELKTLLTELPKQIQRIKAYTMVVPHLSEIRSKVKQAKSEQQILSFDDLISTLESALVSGTHRQALLEQLRQQYPAALVDEFQDTDPGQFNILSSLYFDPSQPDTSKTALYLIGDPKQAIYGFRGGDIFTYLQAAQQVSFRWVMDTNWRSSAAMIHAYNVFFYGNELTEPGRDIFGYTIQYQPVKASVNAGKQSLRLNDNPCKAIQAVHFEHSDDDLSRGQLSKEFSAKMSIWLANQVGKLLSEGVIEDSDTGQERNVKAGDIAILVRDGGQAGYVLQALKASGLSAVYKSERANLLQHPISRALVDALQTIITPEDERRLYGTLAGPFFGFTPTQISELQQDEKHWEQLVQQLQNLHQVWQKRGFMPMAMKLLHDFFPAQYQSQHFGNRERVLTNSIHLFEVLQGLSQQHRQPLQLISQFEYLCQNPQMVETELRLESDADLIQVVTQHGSKGLEYPIVFVPFACIHKDPLKIGNRSRDVFIAHNEQGQINVALGENASLALAMANEQYAEDKRLLYVALTRAKLQCYVFSADFKHSQQSPLGHVLELAQHSDYPKAWQHFKTLAGDVVNYQTVGADLLEIELFQSKAIDAEFEVARFNGRIERDWWLTSFSGLTRGHRHYGISDPDRLDANLALQGQEQQSVAHQIAKGANTGNLLHDILETIEFSAPDWRWVETRLQHSKISESEQQIQQICDWLDQCLQQPLILSNGSRCSLSALTSRQTLKELEFYFPVNHIQPRVLNDYLARFRKALNPENPVQLQIPTKGDIQGMMHGFIDLVFEHDGKYYVCDYKSSYLGSSLTDYQANKLQQHMFENFYDLQALIYSLALHRYLKTRVNDYCFERHFGGAVYLYLRGMGQAKLNPQQGPNLAPGSDTVTANTESSTESNTESSTESSANCHSNKASAQYGVYYHGLSRSWLEALDRLIDGEQDFDFEGQSS